VAFGTSSMGPPKGVGGAAIRSKPSSSNKRMAAFSGLKGPAKLSEAEMVEVDNCSPSASSTGYDSTFLGQRINSTFLLRADKYPAVVNSRKVKPLSTATANGKGRNRSVESIKRMWPSGPNVTRDAFPAKGISQAWASKRTNK